MKKEYEITHAKFYSDCHQFYDVSEDIAIEDIRFIKFTDLLDTADIFKNPKHCRYEGIGLNNAKWGILGYSFSNDLVSEDYEDENEEDAPSHNEYEWNFTFFNGFFSDDLTIVNAKRADIQKSLSEAVKFIESTLSGKSKFIVQDYHPIKELQELILKLQKRDLLERIEICIITNNLIEQENLDSSIFIESLQRECKIHYWGINKWSDLSRTKSKRLPINLDFLQKEKLCYDIPFLERKNNDDLKYYLAIFPGDLIADLYDEYNTQLLENNVRVFLSLKSKYNREMSKTIREDSDMFFSYNNGISATASSIKINTTTNKIEAINDFQIVNGGQTTATLYHTKKNFKKSLSQIYLQVKITVLRKADNYPVLISNISKYANSQTAVKGSDFWTNDHYLLNIEKISLATPVQKDNLFINYFFERMSGQYKETRARKGTDRDILAWEKQNPKSLSFNKIEFARWFNAINLRPDISASSAEKQFEIFMKRKDRPPITKSIYKTIVGFGQLCIRARKVCGKEGGREFPSIIGDPNVGMATSIYAMSYFEFITKGLFDYHNIFDQKVDVSELDDILKSIIKKCWEQIYEFDKIYTRDRTKIEACWKFVKDRIQLNQSTLDKLGKYLITAKERKKRESVDVLEEEYYFRNLNFLLSNNGKVLFSMYDIANSNTDYYKYRTLLKNTIERINNRSVEITLRGLTDLINFKDKLADYDFKSNDKFSNKVNIDFVKLCDKIFKSRSVFFENLEKIVESKTGEDFESHMTLLEELKELVDKFDLYPGLAIKDFERMKQILDYFKI
ncbi:MAG: AIPR family protein [Ferruginibacter sp.]